MAKTISEAIADILNLATDAKAHPDVRRLAESVLILFQAVGENRLNNRETLEQIKELSKRQSDSEEDTEE